MVCLLVMTVSPVRTAEPIEMLFGVWLQAGPRKHQWIGGRYTPTGRGAFQSQSRFCRTFSDLLPTENKAVTDRRLRPRCCHLGSYFKRPKSSPVRPLVCSWYYCAHFIAKPNAACALRFSWAATSSNIGLWANMTSSTKPEVHNVSPTRPEKDTATAIGNMHKNLVKMWKYDRGQTDTLITMDRWQPCCLKNKIKFNNSRV